MGIKNKVFSNAAWIIGCRIVRSILTIIVTMLSARFLGPSGYGIINYAASLVSFVAPVMQLGLNATLVSEMTSSPQNEGEILGTSITLCVMSSVVCLMGLVAFSMIANPGEPLTTTICLLYGVLLIFQALEMIQYWFQCKLMSKYASITALFAYIIISIYRILLLVLDGHIYLYAISQAIDYAIIAMVLFVIYKKKGGQKLAFSTKTAKKLLSKSWFYILSGLMVAIYAQTDKIMLKGMLDEEAVGFYSAAVSTAGMTSFVFSAIIDSFRPVIFEAKKENRVGDYETKMTQLFSVVFYLSVIQSVVICCGAPLIVKILYGEQYAPTVKPLMVVVWYTTFSYLGPALGTWILAEGKQKYQILLNLSGAFLNIILNVFFIRLWGVMGAAVASLITQVFTNFALVFLLKPIRGAGKLMIKAFNPIVIIKMIKSKD